ncbi:MAG: hypothetical protein HUJ73_07120, partial [Eubacterium sp.]|nr:hypothetical protein [Eubacterium sp.]
FAEESGITDRKDRYEEMLAYLAALPGNKKTMYVLKSADKTGEIQMYVPFYEALGMKTYIVDAEDIADLREDLSECFVVSALNQKDILSLPQEKMKQIMDAGCRNDMRTVFLLHDKRFFRLFDCPEFTSKCLTKEETLFLQEHSVKTFLFNPDREEFEKARYEKDGYILKPAKLGKSENVCAGELLSEEAWAALFENDLSDWILQPFIRQKAYSITWEGTPFTDYVSGALLSMDGNYFGPGMFRTSSCPVLNKTDDRKIAPVVTDQYDRFGRYYLL